MEAVLFWIFSTVAIAGAAGVVLNLRNTVSSAVSLVVTMLALAGLFVMLRAEFIGLVQVMVYAGAIVVLFLFVIMLLNMQTGTMGAEGQPLLKIVGLAIVIGITTQLMVLVGGVLQPWPEVGETFGTIRQLGRQLYTDFVLPFELTGVLLLASIVGAVILAKREIDG
ncbi:MAG: NADH-quinone oxidoreductase subunit J [Myxococcota bacterium]